MARTFTIAANNGAQIIPIPGGQAGSHTILLAFLSSPSAGTVTIEQQAVGSSTWSSIQGATGVSIASGAVTVRSDGEIGALRLTFTSLVGGTSPTLWLSSTPSMIPIRDLLTDGGFGHNRRIRVDQGQTGFFARRMWALNYEFASANPIAGTPLVFRFIIPTNFIIHAHFLSVDQGGVVLRTYSADQGVAGGSFSTSHTPGSVNAMEEQEQYMFQSTIDSGGTFTPNLNEIPITPLRVRTSGATAQQSSIGQGAVSEKGRADGTYYSVLARMTGVAGDCTGVYNVVVEERPAVV